MHRTTRNGGWVVFRIDPEARRMSLVTGRLAPIPDRDSAEWWSGVSRHDFMLQRCASCDALRWPARTICGRCRSFEWAWEAGTRQGKLVTWVTTHQPFVPGFDVPYHSVVVQLATNAGKRGDLLLPGIWCSRLVPTIGMDVSLTFVDLTSTEGTPFTLLGWTPADEAAVTIDRV